MNPNKALWEKGDFTRIAATMRESGEALVAGLGVTPGMKVLDLGCGDGTTALPSARLGADVLGVDIASNLVAAGNKRAKEAGLYVHESPEMVSLLMQVDLDAHIPPALYQAVAQLLSWVYRLENEEPMREIGRAVR